MPEELKESVQKMFPILQENKEWQDDFDFKLIDCHISKFLLQDLNLNQRFIDYKYKLFRCTILPVMIGLFSSCNRSGRGGLYFLVAPKK